MIVVDTSVWVAANRQAEGRIADTLRGLLEADEVALALPVKLELWAGTAKADRVAFRRAFSALPVLVPSDDTWPSLERWIARASDAGERFSITDLLIARLTDEIQGIVWSLDHDFERMGTLGFVQTFEGVPSRRR